VAGHLHPEYVEVLRTYSVGRGFEMFHVLHSTGAIDPAEIAGLGEDVAAVIFQQPNFLGLLEEPGRLVDAAHSVGALAIACVDPISLGLLKPPGEYGADIAVGEGQQLGLPPSFGGPHLGFIAAREELVRRLPGRLVGEAHDASGRRGYVLTLTAREQHIRREKATSNICTNHALCALAASVYLSYLGPEGLRQVADVSYRRAHTLAERLGRIEGFEPAFPGAPFLNEFPMRVRGLDQVLARLRGQGMLGGLPLRRWYPELADVAVFCCTELNDPPAIEQLTGALAPVASENR
jgi:glycine dehydrogenase subunit 1